MSRDLPHWPFPPHQNRAIRQAFIDTYEGIVSVRIMGRHLLVVVRDEHCLRRLPHKWVGLCVLAELTSDGLTAQPAQD